MIWFNLENDIGQMNTHVSPAGSVFFTTNSVTCLEIVGSIWPLAPRISCSSSVLTSIRLLGIVSIYKLKESVIDLQTMVGQLTSNRIEIKLFKTFLQVQLSSLCLCDVHEVSSLSNNRKNVLWLFLTLVLERVGSAVHYSLSSVKFTDTPLSSVTLRHCPDSQDVLPCS